MKPIEGKPSICLLSKASIDDSWLWYLKLLHPNFKDINKYVIGDIVRGLPISKNDKDHLCATCDLGKKNRKSYSFIMNTKIVQPLN